MTAEEAVRQAEAEGLTLLRAEIASLYSTCAPDDVLLYQLTSGSTALPKAVSIRHSNLSANTRGIYVAGDGRPTGERFVSWLPLYHDMGLIGAVLTTLYHAVPLVLMSPLAFLLRPERWLWAIHKHRGSLVEHLNALGSHKDVNSLGSVEHHKTVGAHKGDAVAAAARRQVAALDRALEGRDAHAASYVKMAWAERATFAADGQTLQRKLLPAATKITAMVSRVRGMLYAEWVATR